MKNRFLWLLAALVALVLVVVVVDMATGMNGVGAAINFFWRAFAAGIFWIVNSIREFAILLLGRRLWGLASVATSIGFGYLLRIFLSERHAKKVEGWRTQLRHEFTRILEWWNRRAVATKFAIVVALVLLQILLVPAIAQYVVLFPVKFLVNIIFGMVRRIYGYMADSVLGIMYRKYFGETHNRITRRVRAVWLVRVPRSAYRHVRLQYVTAWRLWKVDPKYRDATGERWVSALEPYRLWRGGGLLCYRGRRLLGGKKQHT